MRLTLATPRGFSFRRTVLGHGWYSLPPFVLDDGERALETTVALPGGKAARLRFEDREGRLICSSPGRPDAAARRELERAARRILNLDLDLAPFYAETRKRPETRWIARAGAGRLMRGATGFEDVVKLILTTNCTWSLTTRMTEALVARCGDAAPDGTRAFPRPEQLARPGERGLRERVRTGYRAPQLVKLARGVVRGEIDPEGWDRDPRPPEALRQDLLQIPGAGPYVVENLLRFLGRPCGLGLDSWLRAKYGRVYHGGRRVSDRTIARRYARHGPWAGLTLWCDLTRDWFQSDSPTAGRRMEAVP